MLTGNGGGRGSGTTFTPLIETTVETMGSALANTITANVPGQAYTIALTNHGVSSMPYAQLKKGTAPYTNGITQVTNVKNAATLASKISRVVALTSVHGETDNFNGISGATYEGYLNEWRSDLESDIKAITGQQGKIPLFIDQMSSYFSSYANTPTSEIPIYQLAASENNPGNIFLVTPKYFFDYSDRHHLTAASYRWLGEYYGKVIKKVTVDGEAWRPLSPDRITRIGNTIYAKFHVPAGVLAFDTTIQQAVANKGFEYYDSTSSASISSVSIISSDTVAIVLDTTPTGANQRLRYAYTGIAGTDAGSHSPGAAGGNLRDTDPYPSLHGNTLYNWAVHFDKPIVDDNTPSQAPDMTSASDSGVSNTDNNTSTTKPEFVGSCTSGDMVTIYVDGSPITPNVLCSGGVYSVIPDIDLTDGVHSVTSVFTTNAIGTSQQSPALSVTIDTTEPSLPPSTPPQQTVVGFIAPRTTIPSCAPGHRFNSNTGAPCPSSAPTIPSTPTSFTRDLYPGMTGPDVTTLQRYLNTNGFIIAPAGPGSPGNETAYFGLATKAALRKLQLANSIRSTGNLGPVTRKVIEGR